MIWEDTYNCGYEAVPVGYPYTFSGQLSVYYGGFRFGCGTFTNYIPRRRMYVFNYEKDLLPFYSGTFVPGKRLALGMGYNGSSTISKGVGTSDSIYINTSFQYGSKYATTTSFGANTYISGKIPFYGFVTTLVRITVTMTTSIDFAFSLIDNYGYSYLSIFDTDKVPFMPIMGPIPYKHL